MTNNNIDMKIKRYSKRLKNTLIITFIALLLLPVIATGILFLAVVSDKDYVRFDITKLQNSACDVTFTDAFGNKINVAPTFNKRVGVDFKNLNGYTIDAFICTEDKRFFRHNGVDLVRVVRRIHNNTTVSKKRFFDE
jgi:penicillin-binding protein 2A